MVIMPWDCDYEDLPLASDTPPLDGPYIVISEP